MPEYVSKVVFGNQTLIDLTEDTVDSAHLLTGFTAHDASGVLVTGICDFNADVTNDTVTQAGVLSGQTFHKGLQGNALVGTMPNIGAQNGAISSIGDQVSISQGYHDGSGKISIASTEVSKIIADNIREGVTILGVLGTMNGSEDVKALSTTVIPYTTSKEYTPTAFGDYNYFSAFTVSSIAYSEASNAGGGLTATIGTVAPA